MTQPFKPLTSNLRDTSFHNSVDWPGVYLQVDIPPIAGEYFRFKVFKLLEIAFIKLPSSLISPDHYSPHIDVPLKNTAPAWIVLSSVNA